MKHYAYTLLALLCVFSFAAGAWAEAPKTAAQTIADWPETPRTVANQMIQKYGQPEGITPSRLIWGNRGPWREIIVYREEIPHHFPKPHSDVLEQVINYRVPVEMYDDIAAYDGSVIVERTKGTMAARCDIEGANFLALNLAHDIVTGKRTVQQARQFYADTIRQLMAGETPEYTQRLLFAPPTQNAARDPDVTVIVS